VVGIVEAWGHVEVHRDGFRAQIGRPRALVIAPGRSHKQLKRLARRYDAELLELSGPDELLRLCAQRGWGLSETMVSELVGPETGPAVPRRWGRRARRALRWSLASVGAVAVVALGGVALFTPLYVPPAAPAEKPSPHLHVLDQTVLERDGTFIYVGIVRNDHPTKTAVGVRPIGEFVTPDGDLLGRPDSRFEVENRPALAPGATGVVIDWMESGSAPPRHPARLRIGMTAARLRPGPATAPARISQVRLDRSRCLVTATVLVEHARLELPVIVVVRDHGNRLFHGEFALAGPLRTRRSHQVLARVPPRPCREARSAQAFPNLEPDDVPMPR
jgi:hypothetical protein